MGRLAIARNAIGMRVRAMCMVGPFGVFAAGLRRSGRIIGTKQNAAAEKDFQPSSTSLTRCFQYPISSNQFPVPRQKRGTILIIAGVIVVGCGPRAVEMDGDRIRDQLRGVALGGNGADVLLKLASNSAEARSLIQEEATRMRRGALQRREEALQEEREQITDDRPLDRAAQERLTAVVVRRVEAEREMARLETFLASLP